jgi:hypothetical protein
MDAAWGMGASFGAEHFGGALLGDKRLTDRLVFTADRILQQPEGSFPDKLKDPADLDGFYRLMAAESVTHASVLATHCERTREQMRACADVVLVLHDTTVLDYSGLNEIEELGQVGDGHGRGYYCHNSLAVTPGRRVLGLAQQLLHSRRRVPAGETKAQRRLRPDRESLLWKKASAAIPAAPEGHRWVDIADRGADITEFLDYEAAAAKHYVVRSQHNRFVEIRFGAAVHRVKLHNHLRTLPHAGTRTVEIPAGPGRAARTATMGVAWTELTILPPRQPCGEERGVPLQVWAIRTWELDPPAGVAPVEWLLLTNVPVHNLADANQRIDWYCCRWVIEEFHKVQKTGCAIENMQFTYADRLQPAIGLMSVVAVWLLQLRDGSRDPERQAEPATQWVPQLWIEVLSCWRHQEVRADWSLLDFFMALARLGGHQNRKQDHPPGWIVLWRGWTQLQAMVLGAAGRRAQRCGET